MGSKSVFARAGLAAPVRSSVTRAGITPRTWHPVVYLERGPVRFAGRATMTEAMAEARSLAHSLGARTWSAIPGRASILATAATTRQGGAK